MTREATTSREEVDCGMRRDMLVILVLVGAQCILSCRGWDACSGPNRPLANPPTPVHQVNGQPSHRRPNDARVLVTVTGSCSDGGRREFVPHMASDWMVREARRLRSGSMVLDHRTGLTWVFIRGLNDRRGPVQELRTTVPGGYRDLPSFWISRKEVTVTQYARCVRERACTPPRRGWHCTAQMNSALDLPVTCVDWHQALAYAAWAGGRLPTEAEWEYAASSRNSKWPYPWGDAPADCRHMVMNEDAPGCGTERPLSGCSMPPDITEQGVCDLMGNVSEWLQDLWVPSVGPRERSLRWRSVRPYLRVIRGGNYLRKPLWKDLGYRIPGSVSYWGEALGFRVVR